MAIKQLSPEQLAPIRDLQSKWDQLTKRYGELHYQLKLLNREKESVDAALEAIEEERIVAMQMLQEELGSTGTLNVHTGEFTPDLTTS